MNPGRFAFTLFSIRLKLTDDVYLQDGLQDKIHLHSALGREDLSITACIRRESEVYLMVEAIILELLDTGASPQVTACRALFNIE